MTRFVFHNEQEELYHKKIMELVRRHNLGFLGNPGGARSYRGRKDDSICLSHYPRKSMIQFIRNLFKKNNSEPSNNPKHFFMLRVDDAFFKAFNDLKELVDLSEEEVFGNALNLYDISVKERIYNNKGIVFQDLDEDVE